MSVTQHCGRCDQDKSPDAFGKHRWCKECRAAYTKYWIAANPERARASVARWREANPDYHRQWRMEHADQLREANRLHNARRRAEDPEKVRAFIKAWEIANPDRVRVMDANQAHRRRARRLEAPTIPFTQVQLAARLSMFSACWMCGAPWQHIDHVKPLAAGGAHILANLRPACADCNLRKGAKWPVPTSRSWSSPFRSASNY